MIDLAEGAALVAAGDALLAYARRRRPGGDAMVALAAALGKAVAQTPASRRDGVRMLMLELVVSYEAATSQEKTANAG